MRYNKDIVSLLLYQVGDKNNHLSKGKTCQRKN